MKLLRYWPWLLVLGIALVIALASIPPLRQHAEFSRVHEKGGRLDFEESRISQKLPYRIRSILENKFNNYDWPTYFDHVAWARFSNDKFDDYDLKRIARFPRLKGIELQDSSVSDAGLIYLHGLQEIEELNLRNTGITDEGLEHLRNLKSLEGIYLSKTKVTDEGVARLKEALPDCEIYH